MNPRLAKMNRNKMRNASFGKTERVRRTTAGSVDAMREASTQRRNNEKQERLSRLMRGDLPDDIGDQLGSKAINPPNYTQSSIRQTVMD